MTSRPYAQDPHIQIELALAEARRQGATKATVTFHEYDREATLSDNRNQDADHVQTFNTNIHPATGYQWQTESRLSSHIAPHGLSVEIVVLYPMSKSRSHQILAIGDKTLAQKDTPDGSHTVYLVDARHHTPVLVLADGTTRTPRQYETAPSVMESAAREPGALIETKHHSVIAVAHNPGHRPMDQLLIDATASDLLLDHISQKARDSKGYVWSSPSVREQILEYHPQATLPQAPSTSEYRVHYPDGSEHRITGITPRNAVLCNYDSVQMDLLDYAVENHAPRDVKPVRTKDPDVPVIRLLEAKVENLDGTTNIYPCQPWDMKTQSGRYDNRPVPTGERLPHSRIERVKDIQLTMEIRQRHSHQSDIFTFRCDVYNDQDTKNHLLLLTQDSAVPPAMLHRFVFLHNPQPDENLPEETRQALHTEIDELYEDYLTNNLLHGPQAAAQRALRSIAATTEALSMTNPQSGTAQTLQAFSPAGRVSITLNPLAPPGPGLPEPPVPFVQIDPSALPDATALIVPTSENPGAIRPGHALRYSDYDGKMETFQPEGTDWRKRVHPLTVTMAESRNTDTVRTSTDTAWVVAGVGAHHLVLAPTPYRSR